MIIVYKYGYPQGAGTPDISPFVVKLETWLRMAGIPYETRTGSRSDMPKSKMPTALIDGRLIADSSFIISHIQQTDPRALTDQHLSPLQRAQAEAVKALIENQLYFVGFYLRWCIDESFARYRPLLLDYARRSVPAWQRPLVPFLFPLLLPHVRRQRVRQVREQGMGRHSTEEVLTIGRTGLQAIATLIGSQEYLFGDVPCTVDASVFGQLHTLLKHPFPGPLQDFALAQPALTAYHDRIWQRYWGDGAQGWQPARSNTVMM
jgi:glutathione S-transferase